MLPASPVTIAYRCPGEEYDIARLVHLARLVSGFARCAECGHRDDTAHGPESVNALDLDAPSISQPPRSLFAAEGVRGISLNELTRREAAAITGAFASCLWEAWTPEEGSAIESPVIPHEPLDGEDGADEGIHVVASGRPGPIVVLARDERPASPDLAVGAATALRRMGCQVIDIGPVTRPCFWFAVEHLHAAGGVHVTGSGCDPAWAGLDFVRYGVEPCSAGGTLDAIANRYLEGYSRPTRRPGSQRSFASNVPYEAGLWKHFHALRPLRIALGCASGLLDDLLARILRRQACRVLDVKMPIRARDFDDPRDPDCLRVAAAVRGERAHLGIVIDDDAQRCALFDDRGHRVTPLELLRLFADRERAHNPGRDVAIDSKSLADGHSAWNAGRAASGLSLVDAGSSAEQMARTLRRPGTLCGVADHRYWFGDSSPPSDAVLTLVKLWHLLSTSDAPFSELVDRSVA
jgi:phosphomannomutase